MLQNRIFYKQVVLSGANALIFDVNAFDFDGSLANYIFLSSEKKNITASNRELLDRLRLSPYPQIILFGTNRQGLHDDYCNSFTNGRGSCFPAMQAIADALGGVLDNGLLADIYNDRPFGTAFNQALKYIDKNNKDYVALEQKKINKFYNWIHDESKLTLVYAQMHKLASEYPDHLFNYNFFDDRPDLLDKLHAYFSKYPEMIPPNITLNFKLYKGTIDQDGNEIKPLVYEYPSIQGTRKEADADFRQTVKDMSAVTLEQMAHQGLEPTATGASRGITNYAEAQKYNFNLSPIKCIDHYKPGRMPLAPCPPLTGKTAKKLADTNKTALSKFIQRCTKVSKSKVHSSECMVLNPGSSFSSLNVNLGPSTSSPFDNSAPFIPSSSSFTHVPSSSYRFFPGEKTQMSQPKKGSMMGEHKIHIIEKELVQNQLEESRSGSYSC